MHRNTLYYLYIDRVVKVSVSGAISGIPDPLDYVLPKKLLSELILTNPDLATEFGRDPVGYLVHIEFGRGKQVKEGIIVGVVEDNDATSDFALKNITQVVSLPDFNTLIFIFY